MLDRKPLLVTVVALAALAWIGGSPPAHAGGKNQIKGVAIRDDAGATTVRIQGSGTPTFTVYKLERPTRVVIDVASATLDRSVRGDEPSATFAVGSWSVSQVAAMAMEDGSTSVRVVVTLARPGRYDVKAEGKDVVVKVMARDPAPASVTSADLATARADADRARAEVARVQSEAAAARGQVVDLRSAAATAKKEAETARADARTAQRTAEQEQQKARDAIAAAEVARKAADEAGRVASSASASDRATADKRVAEAKAEAARARTTADRAAAAARTATQKAEADARAAQAAAADEIAKAKAVAAAEVARARSSETVAAEETARVKIAADAEVARARTNADSEVAKARAAAQAATAAAQAANQDAERRIAAAKAGAATAADAARADAARDREAAAQARADAERERAAAVKAKVEMERERAAATAAKAEADRAIADAKSKLAKVEADRKRVEADARLAAQARDEARTAAAQAEARERAARDSEQKAAAERRAAQDAVKQAELERTKAAGRAGDRRADAVRARAAADEKIKDAEARLARAEEARASAEAARKNAERSAALARKDAERTAATARTDAAAAQAAVTAAATARAQADAATREAMSQRATAESQRAAAEQRRADTVAAAERAETRRAQAEAEASAATERRTVEEAAAAQAAVARKAEEAATARARRARETEEQAARAATTGRADAEARKQAAERAADEVERALASERDAAKVARDRRRAAEDAEAEATAAARRKASADEIAAARAEATRLTAERERAERELAAKSKEVTRTRAESERLAAERSAATAELTRLKQAAAEARDTRTREEARLVDVTKALAAAEAAAAAKATAGPPAGADVGPRASGLGPRSDETPAPVASKPVVAKTVVAKPVKTGARVAAVRFAPSDAEHTVVVDLEGAGASAELVRTGTRKAELLLHGATLPAGLARTLDTSRFGGPIRAVSSYTDPASGDVRVVVDLNADVTPRLDTSGGDVRLAFATGAKVRTQSVPGPVVGGFGATSTPVTQTSVAQLGKRKVYRGPTIELDFKDADIHDLLRTLADVGRVNIVVPDEIRANVTVRMKRVPWDQALEVILASKGLWYRKEGNLYRVAPRKQLDAEDEAEAARLKAMVELEAPKPEIYRLNYTDATSAKPTLEPLLSPKGKIEVDRRTNAIIVNDVRANRREIIDLARALDTQTPQISIEARIVEARSQYERQIGIQWGGRALAGAAGGSATGLIFPSTVGFTGGAANQEKPETGVAAPADFAVNLPANGSNGAIGMTLGSVGGNVNINLRLSALEETGTVRIISAPKVTVLNNVEAEMKQGVKIPISIVSAQGTQTQFVNALLALKVTPYVSQSDCAIMMDINVTKDEPDFVNTGARGDPTILNKEAKTRMLVNDGETSVMGGIYTRNTGLSYSKVPFFADIPVLGWLFKNRRETDDRAELLIFITPKITNKASLRCTP